MTVDGLSHTRRCALSTANANVTGTNTNMPVLLTQACLPSLMFDADGAAPAQSGGGDIRFSSDADGQTLLPCEIVAFTTDNDPANGVARIWVKLPNVRSSQSDTFYVWWNTPGTSSQPAAGAANGSEAVWSDYLLASHALGTDSTGTYTLTPTGTAAATGPFGNANGARGFGATVGVGATDVVTAASFATFTQQRTFQAWVRRDGAGAGNEGRVFVNSTGMEAVYNNGSDYRFNRGYSTTAGLWNYARSGDGSFIKIDCTYDSGSTSNDPAFYLNGSALSIASETTPVGTPNTTDENFRIGNSPTGGRNWNGLIAEIRIRTGLLSADWLATEYANQNSPSTFISVGSVTHLLVASTLSLAAASLAQPSVGQVHALTASTLSQAAASLAQPTAAHVHVLAASAMSGAAVVLAEPDIGQVHAIDADDLDLAAAALGQPAIAQIHAITVSTLSLAATSLATPSLGQVHGLTASTLASAAADLGEPALGQEHDLSASTLDLAAVILDEPQLSSVAHDLTADDIDLAAAVLGEPTAAHVHVLSASALSTAAADLGEPSLGQEHDLTADDLDLAAVTLGEPTAAHVHVLSASTLSLAAVSLAQPALGQEHDLSADDLDLTAASLGQPSMVPLAGTVEVGAVEWNAQYLEAEGALEASSLTLAAAVLAEPAVGQVHALNASTLSLAAAALAQPAIGQAHVLTASTLDLAAAALAGPTVGQGHVLAADDFDAAAVVLAEPSMTGEVALTADDLDLAAATLGEPEAGLGPLQPSALSLAAVTLGQPQLGQAHSLNVIDFAAAAAVLGTPAADAAILARGDAGIFDVDVATAAIQDRGPVAA